MAAAVFSIHDAQMYLLARLLPWSIKWNNRKRMNKIIGKKLLSVLGESVSINNQTKPDFFFFNEKLPYIFFFLS